MWTYSQTTGALAHGGCAFGTGYSGHGKGLDNPAMEAVHSVGPLPRGQWRIGPWHDHPRLGPCVAALMPLGHDAHGRSAFFIHGDNRAADHTASDGCIVFAPTLRHAMAASADTLLEVMI
jgi:hypothetical protein